MDEPTTNASPASRSASMSNTPEQGMGDRDSNSTVSTKPSHSQDESTTPMGKPPRTGQDGEMPPPPRPNFKATPTLAQPSLPASQGNEVELPAASTESMQDGMRKAATHSQNSNEGITHATLRKRSHIEVESKQTTDDEDATDVHGEPGDPIAAFNWTDLEARYHEQMNHYGAQERDLYQSFNDLCGYFYVWAETGHAHEVDRSFKRMKTQVTLVQHQEEELESKRQHYVKVVDAFKSALQLLAD